MLSIYCIQIAHHLPKGRNRVKSLFASTSVLVRIGSKLKQSRCKGTCTWEISSVRKWTNLIRCKRIAMMLRRFESYRCYQDTPKGNIINFFLLYLILIGSLLCLQSQRLFSILYIFRYNPDNEKSIIYECGFFPKNDKPINYILSFYTVGLTFLIFDLELLLIFPFVLEITNATTVSFQTIVLFIIILGLDFFYELYNKIICWFHLFKSQKLTQIILLDSNLKD